jgi:xylulokinase
MILTVDVGTSVLKAALFEKDGTVVRHAESQVALLLHQDPLRHEVDAGAWIRGLRSAMNALGAGTAPRIDAVAVSGNGPTLVPASSDGAPLSNAMTWMDRRGVEEARVVADLRGSACDASFFLPKALWLKHYKPEVYSRARWLFSCPEYLTFILTGCAVTFLPTPDYTRSILWDSEIVKALGMDPGKFPPYAATGTEVGTVTATGAAATGVPQGARVFAGAPDFIVSLLGTATVAAGRACVRSGTSEGINVCSPAPTTDRRLLCVSHLVHGCYNVSGFISTSGKALEWFKNAIGRAELSYDLLFDEVAKAHPGADRLLFLPYLAGERTPIWDPLARGAFIGLTLNHGGGEMTRAVVESVAYAIRDVVRVIEEAGVAVADLRITGSPSRSAVWNQIKADVTGKRILVPRQAESDLAGGVCLALYGMGEYESIAAASEAIVTMGASFEPDAVRGRMYDEMFALYKESYDGLRLVFQKMSAIRSET